MIAMLQWRNAFLIQSNNEGNNKFPMLMLANKVDLENRQVSRQQAEEWAQKYNLTTLETSAKDSINVDKVRPTMHSSAYYPPIVPAQPSLPLARPYALYTYALISFRPSRRLLDWSLVKCHRRKSSTETPSSWTLPLRSRRAAAKYSPSSGSCVCWFFCEVVVI